MYLRDTLLNHLLETLPDHRYRDTLLEHLRGKLPVHLQGNLPVQLRGNLSVIIPAIQPDTQSAILPEVSLFRFL